METRSAAGPHGLGPAMVRRLAVLAACLALAHPAGARETREDAVATVQSLISTTDLHCTPLDARRADPEAIAAGGGRHGGRSGGGMGGGGMGGGDGMGGRGEGGAPGDEGAPRRPAEPRAYEAACQEGVGFILINPVRAEHGERGHGHRHDRGDDPGAAGETPAPSAPPRVQYLNCLEAKEGFDKGVLPFACRLKENHDPRPAVQAIASGAGLDCAVDAVRGLGHTEDNSFFEIACARPAGGSSNDALHRGWVLVTARAVLGGRAPAAFSCVDAEINPILKCRLTNVHADIEALRRFVAKTAPGCEPMRERLAGPARAGGDVFEVACRNGEGYMAHRAADGGFDNAVACTDPNLAGQCRLIGAARKAASGVAS